MDRKVQNGLFELVLLFSQMTVTPRSRLSAKDALRHTWMDDAVAVAKAQRLMGIQQTRYISHVVS